MDPLIIDETDQTPRVVLNGSDGIFRFSGKSYPENVNVFYEPVFEYFEKYELTPSPRTTIDFNWLYYNTATSKTIVKILLECKKISSSLTVNWHCHEDFDLMIEKGNELAEVLNIKFNIIIQK